ncbi:MAG: hypothetical protein A3G80_01700 [Betaproteobacteria bacterium RIFCSPLOWO2_12_FULL_62_13b]|nr:MAG: hypothetical protein A3G80_01700 [Betaproteobacteria bacterium RIFCSPLOWO2_12_FULL_62_13b]
MKSMPDVAEVPAQDGQLAGKEGGKLTAELANFAVETKGSDIPKKALETAKILVLDTVGVALAAAPLPVGRIITQYALDAGGSPVATILGGGAKATALMAALANGTLSNALDFNESSHIATHTLPAVLAVAEQNGLSGRDVLEAFAIGFETGIRITQAFDGARTRNGGPTYRGWWHVGVLGPLAATIAVSRLLRLDAQRTAMAIGIASCSVGGFRRNMGTMAKAMHSGNAASAGIQAALLANRGFTADPAIMESPLGFLSTLCQSGERDDAAISQRLGRPYALADKPRIKPFPSCAMSHQGIDAALAIRAQAPFEVEDIETIEADLHLFSLLRPDAPSEDAAGFSAAYLISAALVEGSIGVEQLGPPVLHDPRIRALMKRVKQVPGREREYGPEQLTVRLKNGKVLSVEIDSMRNLTTTDDIERKYRACATRVVSESAAEELRDLILGLDRLPNLDRLMLLAGGSPRAERPHS